MEFSSNFNNVADGFLIDPNSSGGAGAPLGYFQAGMRGSSLYSATFLTRPSNATWHYHTWTMDRSLASNELKNFLDGASASSQNSFGNGDATTGNFGNRTLYLMSRSGSSLFGAGTLDELRVSTAIRSDDWIATDYNNQSSPATFYTIGAPQTP